MMDVDSTDPWDFWWDLELVHDEKTQEFRWPTKTEIREQLRQRGIPVVNGIAHFPPSPR